MADLGLSTRELARLVGVDKSSVARWRLGSSVPTRETALRIVRALVSRGADPVAAMTAVGGVPVSWGSTMPYDWFLSLRLEEAA